MMADMEYCPDCGDICQRRIEHRRETLMVRGEPITVEADVAICVPGGHAIADLDLDDALLERAYDEYRRRFGIMGAEEIRQLRERCGLSQRGFGRLLDWGEMTVHRYETGALPDGAHNAMLIALRDEDTLYRFVGSRIDTLTPLDRRRVRAALEERLPKVRRAVMSRTFGEIVNERSAIERGNRLFDLERIAQMVVFFALRCTLTTTKLNKLLWYADFLAFKRQSLSISGMPYLRYQFGPVPERYSLLYGEMENEGFLQAIPFMHETSSGVYEGTNYEPLVAFDPSLFSAGELAVLETVCKHLGAMNATEAACYSHTEQAWIETPMMDVISYSKAETLSLD